MTTQEYLYQRKTDGRSQIAFCAFTRQNTPEDTAELKQLESMRKNGDVHIVRDVDLGKKNASLSYRLYRINETPTQNKTR